MFNSTGYSLSDIAAVTRNDGGGFGNGDDAWWIILLFLFAGGWGNGNGFGGGGRGACATQEDVRAAVDQQTLISKLDNQTYGLADSTYALNSTIMNGFHGVDNAICTLGYQNQAGFTGLSNQLAQCCCDTKAALHDVNTQSVMNTNAIQQQIAACCCEAAKDTMQNRFDAQTYNCNTLQAIDKLGDRIIDFMTQDRIATLQSENQALKFAASQQAQNAFITANQEAQTAELLRRLAEPCPVPAYVVNPPYPVNYRTCYDFNSCNCCGC